MIREYLARYDYSKRSSEGGCPESADLFACMQLNTRALPNDKNKIAARKKWQGKYTGRDFKESYRKNGRLRNRILNSSTLPSAATLPEYSWGLQFTFKFRTPYLSRDETGFYLFESPVRKDWVFKQPYIAASQWKGMLRSVLVRKIAADLMDRRLDEVDFLKKRSALWRLFGDEHDGAGKYLNLSLARFRKGIAPVDKDEYAKWFESVEKEADEIDHVFNENLIIHGMRRPDMDGFRGCLYFHPTYFNNIGLEVINPHLRDTGAGTKPIFIECVPRGTCGELVLLYAPLAGTDRAVRLNDLDLVVSGLWTLLTEVGIGAKTSSGFGRAVILKQGTCDQNTPSLSSMDEFRVHCREMVEKGYGAGIQQSVHETEGV